MAPTTTSCCVDVSAYGLTGRQAESALLDAGVVTNRNSVPVDPNGAWYTSGVRIGTPALTTRGFGPAEFDRVAELMIDVFKNTTPEHDVGRARRRRRRTRSADGVAERTRAASAEMLDAQPALPGPRALSRARCAGDSVLHVVGQ